MKSVATRKKFPAKPAEWEQLIAAAPGRDSSRTAKEAKQMADVVIVNGGGYAAVRAALAAKRKRGERGPQFASTKQLVVLCVTYVQTVA